MMKRVIGLVAALILVLPLGVARAEIDVPPAQLPTQIVTRAQGRAVFHIADASARVSAAWRDNADRADKDGVIPPPTGGYTLMNRVIVRAASSYDVREAIGTRPGVTFTPFAYAPDCWIVTTPSVKSALDVAKALSANPAIGEATIDMASPTELRGPTDPNYVQQWHLYDSFPEDPPGVDLNVEPVWDLGYTGAGVTIGIVEYGFWPDNPDIAANYNATASQATSSTTSWWHGTACAGLAAAVANNGQGGVGVAYGAQVSRQIVGTASQTATAIGYRNDLNLVKSNSWGPSDDGVIDYMSSTERDALVQAVTNGRGGRGTVIVWASGNGGDGDRVDCDPYASSRYTIAIGALTNLDRRALYSEVGSSLLAVTPSDGGTRKIFTTTYPGPYTSTFGGTSAASPEAAGVVALMLEANPELTWRDVQHVLINSTRICDPNNADWTMNAAGHLVNYNYGFGAVDAYAAVTLAQQWRNVRPEVGFQTDVIPMATAIPDDDWAGVTRTVDIADDIRLESVELVVNTQGTYIGDLQIEVTSPAGTTSIVTVMRADSTDNYVNYLFTTLRHWDENSAGTWTVKMSDRWAGDTNTWVNYQLRFHGTPRPGDVNKDLRVNVNDVDPFVLALVNPEQFASVYPNGDYTLADTNEDGEVDFADINPMVDLLLGQ